MIVQTDFFYHEMQSLRNYSNIFLSHKIKFLNLKMFFVSIRHYEIENMYSQKCQNCNVF